MHLIVSLTRLTDDSFFSICASDTIVFKKKINTHPDMNNLIFNVDILTSSHELTPNIFNKFKFSLYNRKYLSRWPKASRIFYFILNFLFPVKLKLNPYLMQ